MLIYAGIDEAGYGPMFGPLLVGRGVMALERLDPADTLPCVWQLLESSVCRQLSNRQGRLAINDSKKVYTPASGLKHLEMGVLAFAGLAGHRPNTLDGWLDVLGEQCHRQLDHMPWYAPSDDQPWNNIPASVTDGELSIARSMLALNAKAAGVRMLDVGASVVFEDRFNRMVAATRSKAATSFTFVATHLQHIWKNYGVHSPIVVVDRQSGRTHYRELLAINFPGVELSILEETEARSAYRLEHRAGSTTRRMNVSFEVEAERQHMPVALASMVSKYTREMLMARFNAWFTRRAPHVGPTAGYASDAKRFWREIEPLLSDWRIEPHQLRRMS